MSYSKIKLPLYIIQNPNLFMMKAILSLGFIFLIMVSGYAIDNKVQILSRSFISDVDNEGYIANSKQKVLFPYYAGGQGKEITIGWNGQGYAMRGFISFDFSWIKPKNGEQLIIDKAVLKVFEANTNMHPFNGDGERTVQCYLLDYQDLDPNDFDIQPIDNCGTIAVTGYSVLTEHPLVVTSKLVSLLSEKPATTQFQFRLQFTSDDQPGAGSELKQSMWNIFAGSEVQKAAYRPVLVLKYHYRKSAIPARGK
jgi:hypothetical protein